MSAISKYPGRLWSQWYDYDHRFQYGRSTDIKIVSMVAAETIYPGTLLGVVPGTETVRVIRAGDAVAGICLYDPHHFDHSVVFQAGDVLDVLRRGSAFVQFIGAVIPTAMQPSNYYAGAGMGQFSTDENATPLGKAVFSTTAKDFYMNSDGSQQADIPYPVPPIPPGATDVTFGTGVVLVDISL